MPRSPPVFQSLPGASFIINGVVPAQNSALTSAGAELRLANGVTLLAKFDGEFTLSLVDLWRDGNLPRSVVAWRESLGQDHGLKVSCGSKCGELEPSISDGH
jgi:hypothetical protein